MKIVDIVKTVQIFERGDLIMFTDKSADINRYGVVIEDQDPNDTNHAWVRSIKTGKITKWFGVHDEVFGTTHCKFVMHLDKVDIDPNFLI